MAAWTRTEDGWRLELGRAGERGSSLPRLEVRASKGTWIICVLGTASGLASTGTVSSVEEAQRAAVTAAREFLDRRYRPLLTELLSEPAERQPRASLDESGRPVLVP